MINPITAEITVPAIAITDIAVELFAIIASVWSSLAASAIFNWLEYLKKLTIIDEMPLMIPVTGTESALAGI